LKAKERLASSATRGDAPARHAEHRPERLG
jgi:hypothetical protein